MDKKNRILSLNNIARLSLDLSFIMFALSLCVPGSARATQKLLTADDLASIILKSASTSPEPISLATQILGNLGEDVTVTGDVLRKSLTDSHIVLAQPLSFLVGSVELVAKSGSTVVLRNDRELRTSIKGIGIRLKPTITLSLAIEADRFIISNISGVAVHKLFWFDVQQVQLGLNQKHSSVYVLTSGGSRQFSFPRA